MVFLGLQFEEEGGGGRERAGTGFNVHNTTGPIMLAGANMQFNDVFSQPAEINVYVFLTLSYELNNKTTEAPAPPPDLDYQETSEEAD